MIVLNTLQNFDLHSLNTGTGTGEAKLPGEIT